VNVNEDELWCERVNEGNKGGIRVRECVGKVEGDE
jgi:hypothetical protein